MITINSWKENCRNGVRSWEEFSAQCRDGKWEVEYRDSYNPWQRKVDVICPPKTRSSTESIATLVSEKAPSIPATLPSEKKECKTFWRGAAEFGKRFFAGAIGAAIPTIAGAAVLYRMDSAPSLLSECLWAMGLGISCASVTSTAMQSFKCSLLGGAAHEATMLMNCASLVEKTRNAYQSAVGTVGAVWGSLKAKWWNHVSA